MIYRCLAGHRWNAAIIGRGPDGSVDLAVDALCNDPVQLTRIKVVEQGKLVPGTCCEGDHDGEGRDATKG